MTSEALEFLISQYADGTIDPAQRATVEAILAQSAEARRLLAEQGELDTALRTAVPALPELDWAAWTSEISAATSQLAPPASQSFRIGPLAWPARLAMAASILIALGLAILATRDNSATRPESVAGDSLASLVDVQGPAVEPDPANDSTLADDVNVSIGPPAIATATPDASPFAQDIVWRPARVSIDVAEAEPATSRIVH
jgi:hypothetical protein